MNWRTSTLGVLTIIVAVAGAGKTFLATGQVPDISAVVAAVVAGVGLITARDAKN